MFHAFRNSAMGRQSSRKILVRFVFALGFAVFLVVFSGRAVPAEPSLAVEAWAVGESLPGK